MFTPAAGSMSVRVPRRNSSLASTAAEAEPANGRIDVTSAAESHSRREYFVATLVAHAFRLLAIASILLYSRGMLTS
jgi:hypothetical protein